MTLFSQFEKFGIELTDLKNLSNQEIIRFEKRLRAEAKMGSGLEVGEIELILDVLKNHKTELEILHSSEFGVIYNILSRPAKFQIHVDKVSFPPEIDLEEMSLFIHKFFGEDLKNYIERCFQKGFYNGIYTLLKFKPVLSPGLVDDIQLKLKAKLNYAIECMIAPISEREKKINYCTNPFFFRSLSMLSSVYYENDMIDYLNATIETLKTGNFRLRLLFAMGAFRAVSDSLKDALAQNTDYARSKGANEVLIDPLTKKKTGGTKINPNFDSVIRRGKSRERSSYPVVYGIVVLLIFGLRFSRTCERSDRHSSFDSIDFTMPQNNGLRDYFRDLNSDDTLNISEEGMSFKETIEYLHSDEVEILNETAIPFETDASKLNDGITYPDKGNITLINRTERHMVLMLKSPNWSGFELVKPNGKVETSVGLMAIRVYFGQEPQIVEYIDPQGDTLSHFKFKKVTPEELELSEDQVNINDYFSNYVEYKLEIIQNKNLIETRIISASGG